MKYLPISTNQLEANNFYPAKLNRLLAYLGKTQPDNDFVRITDFLYVIQSPVDLIEAYQPIPRYAQFWDDLSDYLGIPEKGLDLTNTMLIDAMKKKICVTRINPWMRVDQIQCLESAIAERAIINKILELCGD